MTQPIGRAGLTRLNSVQAAADILFPSLRRVALFDDFLGDAINANWNEVEGTDAATSNTAILAGGLGGVCRFTTGDAGTGLAADLIELNQSLQWRASNGGLSFKARLKLSAITNAYVFVGFTDTLSLEAPVESSGSADGITTNATDAVGFLFDTRMTTKNWWAVGVANDVDATKIDLGVAPVANEYVVLEATVTKNGKAAFYINGARIGGTMTGAVTSTVALTPVLGVSKTSGASSMTMDVDWANVAMDRAAEGGAN